MGALIFVEQREDGKIFTSINCKNISYHALGLVVCDIVRHIAKAYRVKEEDVWEWVDKERMDPTTEISEVKPF